MGITGKTVVITGASRGIGRALALEFAARGARLVLGSRSIALLEDLSSMLREKGSDVVAFPLDLRSEESIQQFAEAAKAFGPADILVNNAGVAVYRRFALLTLAEIDSMLTTNIRGTILLTRAFLPDLTRKPGGLIIMVTSRLSDIVVEGRSVYCVTKAALRAFARSLQMEYVTEGLRVTELRPAAVVTGLGGSVPQEWSLQPAQVASIVSLVADQPESVSLDEILVRNVYQPPF